jgi:hypothetical protein
MSNEPKDGGPAFPKLPDEVRNGSAGMSLRDWFAGQAIVGHLHLDPAVQASYAKMAYSMADAMLSAREQAT